MRGLMPTPRHPSPPPGGEGKGEGGFRTGRARDLRKNQTDAERMLWAHLRDRRLKGKKFRRQQPVGRFFLDFYCPEARLAIELDGGQHDTPEQKAYDQSRTKELHARGITVLRYWDHEVWNNLESILKTIWKALPDQ